MGCCYTFACRMCDYEKTYTLGIGMRTNPECFLIEFAPKFEGGILLPHITMAKEQPGTHLDSKYGYDLYCCQNCQDVYSQYYFAIIYDGGVFTPDYYCPTCGQLLLLPQGINYLERSIVFVLESDAFRLKCPVCRAHLYNQGLSGLWD